MVKVMYVKASRRIGNSSMFLVLRPLIIFEMAAPFVEPINQLNKKCQLHCCEWNLHWKTIWPMFCWLKLVAGVTGNLDARKFGRGVNIS